MTDATDWYTYLSELLGDAMRVYNIHMAHRESVLPDAFRELSAEIRTSLAQTQGALQYRHRNITEQGDDALLGQRAAQALRHVIEAARAAGQAYAAQLCVHHEDGSDLPARQNIRVRELMRAKRTLAGMTDARMKIVAFYDIRTKPSYGRLVLPENDMELAMSLARAEARKLYPSQASRVENQQRGIQALEAFAMNIVPLFHVRAQLDKQLATYLDHPLYYDNVLITAQILQTLDLGQLQHENAYVAPMPQQVSLLVSEAFLVGELVALLACVHDRSSSSSAFRKTRPAAGM